MGYILSILRKITDRGLQGGDICYWLAIAVLASLVLRAPSADAQSTCPEKPNHLVSYERSKRKCVYCKYRGNYVVKYDKRKRGCTYKKCKKKPGMVLIGTDNQCTYSPERDYGDWRMRQSSDVLTGALSVTAALSSSVSFYNGIRYEYADLVMRCKAGELDVYISTNDFLDSDYVQVNWRWETSSEIVRQRWIASTDGTAAFYPFSSDVGTLIQNLALGDAFIAQFENYGSGMSDAYFNLGPGARYAAEDVLNACPEANQFCPFGQSC